MLCCVVLCCVTSSHPTNSLMANVRDRLSLFSSHNVVTGLINYLSAHPALQNQHEIATIHVTEVLDCIHRLKVAEKAWHAKMLANADAKTMQAARVCRVAGHCFLVCWCAFYFAVATIHSMCCCALALLLPLWHAPDTAQAAMQERDATTRCLERCRACRSGRGVGAQRDWNPCWTKSFALIESKFGASTAAFFYFSRAVLVLNLLICIPFLFILGMTLH